MEIEDISKKHPRLHEEEVKSNNPLRKPLQLMQHFPKPKEGESAPHRIVHTPHVNNHLLRPYLTKPAIDLFYMKVISILEQQTKLTHSQARATLTHAQIDCTLEGEQLKATCRIDGAMTITFLFSKSAEGTHFSQLRGYSVGG